MGLNEDLGDRENVGNASLASSRAQERLVPDRDLLFRALELCNESRDRLTRFSRPVEGWIEEARYERDNQ